MWTVNVKFVAVAKLCEWQIFFSDRASGIAQPIYKGSVGAWRIVYKSFHKRKQGTVPCCIKRVLV